MKSYLIILMVLIGFSGTVIFSSCSESSSKQETYEGSQTGLSKQQQDKLMELQTEYIDLIEKLRGEMRQFDNAYRNGRMVNYEYAKMNATVLDLRRVANNIKAIDAETAIPYLEKCEELEYGLKEAGRQTGAPY